MTLEIISPTGDFMYRQRPSDPCRIECRRNKANARWLITGRYASVEEARSALLAIEAAWRRHLHPSEGFPGSRAEQEGE